MPATRLALAVIGDEIGPSLPEMISFCAENRVTRLDMRTVDGRNLMIQRRLRRGGINTNRSQREPDKHKRKTKPLHGGNPLNQKTGVGNEAGKQMRRK